MDSLSPVSFSYTGVSSSSEEVSATEASTFSSAARAIFAEEINPNTGIMLTHRTDEIPVMVFLQHPPDCEIFAGQRSFLLGCRQPRIVPAWCKRAVETHNWLPRTTKTANSIGSKRPRLYCEPWSEWWSDNELASAHTGKASLRHQPSDALAADAH